MKIGVIGLGKMGGPIAKKLQPMDCDLMVYDTDEAVVQEFAQAGFTVAKDTNELSAHSTLIWVMVPQQVLDSVLDDFCTCVTPGTILIDGGNSFYADSARRYQSLKERQVSFLDCGTSGGLYGAEHGFSMTIGGEHEVFKKAEDTFKLVAASSRSYLYVGPPGAGHYVKMVHNGIEYALLEAYAEGFHMLQKGPYDNLDLVAISRTWLQGAIIRSWVLQLAHNALEKKPDFSALQGVIGETGTGRWTVEEAYRVNIPIPVIEASLAVRVESRKTGGNYATKLVTLLRHEMGGHPLTQKECEVCQHMPEK